MNYSLERLVRIPTEDRSDKSYWFKFGPMMKEIIPDESKQLELDEMYDESEDVGAYRRQCYKESWGLIKVGLKDDCMKTIEDLQLKQNEYRLRKW